MELGLSFLSAACILTAAIMIWQRNMAPRVQCGLLFVGGVAGLGNGVVRGWFTALNDFASSTSASVTGQLFGIAVPVVLLYTALLIFVLDVMKKVPTKPIGWHSRIAAVLSGPAVFSVPAMFSAMFASPGYIAVLAAITFGVFLWQGLFPKAQLVLLIVVGWGIGGVLGGLVQMAFSAATDAADAGTSLLWGKAIGGLLAFGICLLVVLYLLPDSKVNTRPVTWTVRICALAVPTAVVMLPVFFSAVSTVAGG